MTITKANVSARLNMKQFNFNQKIQCNVQVVME